MAESRDPDRPSSIDYAGHGADRAHPDAADPRRQQERRLGLALRWPPWAASRISVAAGFAFVAVEQRVAVPLLDLALLRNRILVGSTIAILIGAGTINGLMYLLSLYFQDPATLDFTPLQAGLATLPATVGLVAGGAAGAAAGGQVRRPADDRRRASPSPPPASSSSASSTSSWKYAAFLLPLVAIAVGMGLSNGPSSSAATACVPEEQVGEASGVSNMARYVGAAVATALAATIYGTVIANQTDDGAAAGGRARLGPGRGRRG